MTSLNHMPDLTNHFAISSSVQNHSLPSAPPTTFFPSANSSVTSAPSQRPGDSAWLLPPGPECSCSGSWVFYPLPHFSFASFLKYMLTKFLSGTKCLNDVRSSAAVKTRQDLGVRWGCPKGPHLSSSAMSCSTPARDFCTPRRDSPHGTTEL